MTLAGLDTDFRVAAEALTLDNVDFIRGLLTVEAAFSKNGKQKIVPLHPILVEALRAQIERSESE